jgi:alpha-amylase
MPGIPLVKFGTEIPLDDGGQLNQIKMMNFKISDEQLSHRIEKLNSIRDQFPALTRGDFELLHNENGFIVYKRSYQDQSMIVAINNATETKVAELESIPEGYQLRGLLKDGIVRQQGSDAFRLGMERETADVFVVEPNEGYNWLFIGFVVGVLGLFVGFVTIMGRKNRKTQ